MLHSYLIKNGVLLSILNGSVRKADILVEDGKIIRIAENIHSPGAEVMDAEGMFVTVGWLEAHCHFARPGDSLVVDPVEGLLRQGITYALDLGTLGPDDFERCREELSYVSDLRYMSYLNIANQGIVGSAEHKDFYGPEDIDPQRICRIVTKYRQDLLGLKARIDDKFCYDPLYVMQQIRRLGDELKLPIAIHAHRSKLGLETLLPMMKKGDVLCHVLSGASEAMDVVDAQRHIKPCVRDAQERGVIFDLSHGTTAFGYRTAEAAWQAGFFPDTISSDLHSANFGGPVFNLGVTLTKMRGLTRKPWFWLLHKAIAAPVQLQHISNKELEIKEGMAADLTVFRIEQGTFHFMDSCKEERTFHEKIVAIYTCTGAKIYICRT